LKWKRGVGGHELPPKLQQLEMGSVKKKGELEKAKKLNFRPNGKQEESTRQRSCDDPSKATKCFRSSKATTKKCVLGGELLICFEAGTLAHNTPQTWPFVSWGRSPDPRSGGSYLHQNAPFENRQYRDGENAL
jgi:hypothetical protein